MLEYNEALYHVGVRVPDLERRWPSWVPLSASPGPG